MCELCEVAKVAVPTALPFLAWLTAWWRSRRPQKPPACPLCGPVPKGAPACLCYEHYSRNNSYSRLFLEPLEEMKQQEDAGMEREQRLDEIRQKFDWIRDKGQSVNVNDYVEDVVFLLETVDNARTLARICWPNWTSCTQEKGGLEKENAWLCEPDP